MDNIKRLCGPITVVMLLSLSGLLAFAQSASPRKASNPRDFSGVWMNKSLATEQKDENGKMIVRRRNEEAREGPAPPLTPQYLSIYQKLRAQTRGEPRDPSLGRLDANASANCQWIGAPGIMGWPYPVEFVHTDKRIFILFEAELQRRQIWMDGRKHPTGDDLEYTFMGHSTGRWEGNVLVVDTVGLREEALLFGLPHSAEARMVERIKLVDPSTLEDEFTITDPKALTQPLVRKITYGLKPDWELLEYSCTDNNRNSVGADGKLLEGVVK
jgi:hypothetical protein